MCVIQACADLCERRGREARLLCRSQPSCDCDVCVPVGAPGGEWLVFRGLPSSACHLGCLRAQVWGWAGWRLWVPLGSNKKVSRWTPGKRCFLGWTLGLPGEKRGVCFFKATWRASGYECTIALCSTVAGDDCKWLKDRFLKFS